jgi:glycosyltransferase involved in cell wall biosynthesis
MTEANSPLTQLGLVAIGRNEGDRLQRCLTAVSGKVAAAVYVDSGSVDGSVARARGLGVDVVELDSSSPFTAARARNAGLSRLLESSPGLAFVQFVDGDCEVVDGWLETGLAFLLSTPRAAAVSGRRRERHPEQTVYNSLTDMEWDTPVGAVRSCHGDAMFRVQALQEAGGFNGAMICGEEPELCVRLRASGWEVHRIDCEMTRHDAAMTRFSQWWKRSMRGGWAYAEGVAMHGRPPERHNVRELRSVWFWALGLPLLALGLAGWTRGWTLLLVLGYPALTLRIYSHRRHRGDPPAHARRYALFCTLAKWPQLIGVLQYWGTRLLGRQRQLIEYKGAGE